MWVHPRIRGEDHVLLPTCIAAQGSPPHTRGRFCPGKLAGHLQRFTPAYAGKIMRRSPKISAHGVHPRIRGEDSFTSSSFANDRGSPPHTRGRSGSGASYSVTFGFTPAYAGKIIRPRLCSWRSWVHPRIRGEDDVLYPQNSFPLGSPPHTRGRFMPQNLTAAPVGFTPAYAGKIG